MPKLTNAWTGGQYSVFRAILGIYLLAHFATLLPWGAEMFSSEGVLPEAGLSPLAGLFPNLLAVWDAPIAVTLLLSAAVLASVAFTVGFRDKVAAVVLWYAWACLFGRNPLIANPSIPCVGWMLLAHLAVPKAPYGSVDARGRIDPGNGWRMPNELFAVAWIVMAVAYTYSGYTKLVSPSWADGTAFQYVLNNPLARTGPVRDLMLLLPPSLIALATLGALAAELAFAPLALITRTRPLLWLTLLLMHCGLLTIISFADLSLGMVMLHLFTFDPGWIRDRWPKREAGVVDTVYYDGGCGLCHGVIRFLLSEDAGGTRFRYAPLDGETHRRDFTVRMSRSEQRTRPDSITVVSSDGSIFTRWNAVWYLSVRLGGIWRVIATILDVLPKKWLDGAYDGVARIRHRLFRKPDDVCPILPPILRQRFLP
jgi:predicted DCC family thiol-disulfide oxidoreductase YuxK